MTRREKRKRDHIPLSELLASALADRLPAVERDYLREKGKRGECPASFVIALFTPDHVHLHALGGSDRWHNITMTRRGPELKAKDARDTSIVAKSDRVSEAHREHLQEMARKLAGPSPFVDMPERGSRGRSRWAPGRKLQGGNSFQTRRGNRQ